MLALSCSEWNEKVCSVSRQSFRGSLLLVAATLKLHTYQTLGRSIRLIPKADLSGQAEGIDLRVPSLIERGCVAL